MTIHFGPEFNLKFALEPTPIAKAWREKMDLRHRWPLDDPGRFYGFSSPEKEKANAIQALVQCIETINQYQPIIQRKFTNLDDQDLLNYLHHIFEKYHGLLDQQQTTWFQSAPTPVRQALAQLNIAVHRAESVTRGNSPRFVCTWFGMPKDTELPPELMLHYGTLDYEFGGIYLNYVEIGKTLEDLSIDGDQYISDDAFQPFRHYSADFCARFYDCAADIEKIEKYYKQHQSFFNSRGIYSCQDYRVKPLRYKVASLKTDLTRIAVLEKLSRHQHITAIYLE